MSWFTYDEPKPRSLRKGVCLRVKNLPQDIMSQWSGLCQPRPDERIDRVDVLEILPKGKGIVRCWSRVSGVDPIDRHVVVEFMTDENPLWICEGDVGVGYKPDRSKRAKQDVGN